MVMRTTGKGTCFAHGPYENVSGMGFCPKWPDCAVAPHDQKWVKYAATENRIRKLYEAAAILEELRFRLDVVADLRMNAVDLKETLASMAEGKPNG